MTKRKSVYVSPENHQLLTAINHKTGIPISRLLDDAVAQFIKANYPEVKTDDA